MTLSKKALLSLIITGALFIGFIVGLEYFKSANTALGSVAIGNGYHATTTGIGVGYPGAVNSYTSCNRFLGSIQFYAPTASRLQIYDIATTTNVNLRTGNQASSTVLIADFPAGTGTSTVVFDVDLTKGLTTVWSGTISSTTITCR